VKYNGNSGFLHCAAHDETVNRFGRNDDFTIRKNEGNNNIRAQEEQRPGQV
jgi:hypothetical protein